jgi:hypothetical protein
MADELLEQLHHIDRGVIVGILKDIVKCIEARKERVDVGQVLEDDIVDIHIQDEGVDKIFQKLGIKTRRDKSYFDSNFTTEKLYIIRNICKHLQSGKFMFKEAKVNETGSPENHQSLLEEESDPEMSFSDVTLSVPHVEEEK